jgi:DedD protein
MDRQLAERMVGAACLLAVLVLVVPAILDGNPDPGATITHPPPEEALNLRTHTIHLDRAERDPPVPVAGQVPVNGQPLPPSAAQAAPELAADPDVASKPESASATLDSGPVAAPPSESPKPAAVHEPVRPLAQEALGGSSGWFVQLGSFSRRDNADRLAAQLQGKGFSASVLGGGGASGTLFRVRAGPEADRAGADELAGRLAAAGFPGGHVGR